MNIIKLSLEQKEKTVSTTTTVKNKSVNSKTQNSLLFNRIDKLAADHDVTVSSTMIKVTYKKALKNKYTLSSCGSKVNFAKDPVLTEGAMNSLNSSEDHSNKNVLEITRNISNVYNSESILVPSNSASSDLTKEETKSSVFHSTPKQCKEKSEKRKREHFNGLNLFVKVNKSHVNDSLSNNHFTFHNNSLPKIKFCEESRCQTKSNSKTMERNAVNKTDKFQTSNIKFLKGVTLVRLEDSIKDKNHAVGNESEPKNRSSESSSVYKDKKLQNKVKRKMKLEESVVPHKQLKKNVVNHQSAKRKSSVKVSKIMVKDKKVKSIEKKVRNEENVGESNNCMRKKKELMREDPELPDGWKRFIRTKHGNKFQEKHIVYVISPEGRKFRFKWKLRKYLEKTKSSLVADQFYFGLYKRKQSDTIVSDVPIINKEGNKKKSKNSKALLPKEKSNVSSKEKNTSVNSLMRTKVLNPKTSSSMVNHPDKSNSNQGKIRTDAKNTKSVEASNNVTNKSSSEKVIDEEKRQLLLCDPDLPFGWKRVINSNTSNGKLQVHIISPEGRIFRRRYRLNEYLMKHQYTHNLDRFYFGLYPKKEVSTSSESSKHLTDSKFNQKALSPTTALNGIPDKIKNQVNAPMYDDPSLPEGWKRYIKIRSCGESAGRMEVIIVSPDGRKLRSKRYLEHYLKQNNLDYKAEDFDFSVFGRAEKRSIPRMESKDFNKSKDLNFSLKKKSKLIVTDKPVPNLDISDVKDIKVTREGEMVNAVSALMVNCGLSSVRSERRSRLSKNEHEKILKNHLDSEGDASRDGCDISTYWIQKLVKCRSNFRFLEADAAATVAEKTKEFLKEVSLRAFQASHHPETGLTYEDVADLVLKSNCLSPLKTLIPTKITFKEYIRLNRPKQFMSFT